LIRAGFKAVAVGIGILAILYVLDWFDTSPSLVERQTAAAEEAVREEPSEVGLRLRLADIYRAAKRPDDALEQYDAVLGVEADQGTALLGRGEVLAEMGELSEAQKAFEKIIGATKGEEFAAVNPQIAAAYYGLSSVLLKQGKTNASMEAARNATKIEPTDADSWYLVGVAAIKAGANEKAVEALRQVVLFVPIEWCAPYEKLAQAYSAQGRKSHARYATAMVDLCEKRPEEATKQLKPLASGPVKLEAMLGLAMAAEAESDRTAAARWYQKVLAVDSENFNAQSGLGRLGVATGG
jgi:tetratricopeptide (TPR) repeat protein